MFFYCSSRTFLCCGAITETTVLVIWIVTVIPVLATAWAGASGNGLALGTLEALEPRGTLRVAVAFPVARLQVFGFAVVGAAQGQRVTTLDASIFHAIGEVIARFTLRTLRILGACARFRRGTAINLSANWVAKTLDK